MNEIEVTFARDQHQFCNVGAFVHDGPFFEVRIHLGNMTNIICLCQPCLKELVRQSQDALIRLNQEIAG